MDEALAEFLRHLALEKNASPHTVKSYREDLTQALDFFRTRLGEQNPGPDRLTTRAAAGLPRLAARTGLRQDDRRPPACRRCARGAASCAARGR